MGDGWTVVRRRRQEFKKYSSGVITMYVANLPDGTRVNDLRKAFIKYGDIRDIYMAKKKDSGKRNFAFVRFAKVGNELDLEASMQGIRRWGRLLEVNIAKFDMKELSNPTRPQGKSVPASS